MGFPPAFQNPNEAQISNDAYGLSWSGDTATAASKNALYNKIESITGGAEDAAEPLHGLDGDSFTGALISINPSTTTFDVAPFDYYISGTKYSYAGVTNQATGFTDAGDFIIVGIDALGLNIKTKNSFYTPGDLDTILEIGGLVTLDGSTILNVVGDSSFKYNNLQENIYKWAKFGKQTDFIGTAGSISEGTTPLRLSIASGDIIDPNLNREFITAQALIDSVLVYKHVAGVWVFEASANPFFIDNLQYDDGTDLATLGNNKWASHTIARSSRSQTIYFIYSQGQFDNEADAIDAEVSLGGFGTEVGNEVEPLAKIVIQKNSANINTVIDVRNQASNIVSASTSTLQITYDRSAPDPEIETTPTNGALTVKGGTGVDTDSVYEGKNNAGDITFTVQANGSVGIGTDNPSSTITVVGDGEINKDLIGFSHSTAHLSLQDATTENMRLALGVDSDAEKGHIQAYKAGVGAQELILQGEGGDAGIGTASPVSKLSVAGDIDLGSVDGRSLSLYKNSSGTEFAGIANVVESGGIVGIAFSTSTDSVGVERIRIKGNGNLGLGTTNPSEKLEIKIDDGNGNAIKISGGFGSGIGRDDHFSYIGSGVSGFNLAQVDGGTMEFYSSRADGLGTAYNYRFKGGENNVDDNDIRIYNGNLGLGADNPQTKLNIDYGSTDLVAQTDVIRIDFESSVNFTDLDNGVAKISLGEGRVGFSTAPVGSIDFDVSGDVGFTPLSKVYRFKGEASDQDVTMVDGNIGLGKDYADTKIHIDYGATSLTSKTDVFKTDFIAQAGAFTGNATAKISLGSGFAGAFTSNAASMDFELDGTAGAFDLQKIYRFIGEDASRTITIKDGGLGVGTDNPSAKLDIEKGSIGTYAILSGDDVTGARGLVLSSSTTTNIGDTHTINAQSATGELSLATGGTEAVRVDTNQKVNATRSRSNAVGDVSLAINPSDSTAQYGFRLDQLNNNLNLDNVSAGTNVMSFANGKVGITTGNDAIVGKLDIKETGSNKIINFITDPSLGGDPVSGSIWIESISGDAVGDSVDRAGLKFSNDLNYGGDAVNPYFSFDGNVGIKNDNPSSTLSVSGTALLDRATHGTVLEVRGGDGAGDANQGAQIRMQNTAPAATDAQKSIRITDTGVFEVLNSAYSSTILRIRDDGKAGINNADPTSSLTVKGSVAKSITTLSATTTLNDTHYTILSDASAASFTLNLPAASSCLGRIYVIKKIDSSLNTVTIDANATETIDGDLTKQINVQYTSIAVQSNGSNWFVI